MQPPVSEAALAERPGVIAVVLIAWFAAGLCVAAVMSRRGHAFRPLGGLGVAFGPLLLGVVLANLRFREQLVRPKVLRSAGHLGGHRRALVAVFGAPEQVVDAIPPLQEALSELAQVEIAVPVTYDTADAEPDDDAQRAAVRTLDQAALFLEEFQPGLVLVPGPGVRAITRYAEREGIDVVMVAGDRKAQAALCRLRGPRTVAVMLGTAADDDR